jgi:hypothetical protein
MLHDLQFLINEDVPLALIRPKRDERKNLVGRKYDVPVVCGTLEVFLELAPDRLGTTAIGVELEKSGWLGSGHQFLLDRLINKFFGWLNDENVLSLGR